jgi:hypothetical protein
MRWIRVPESNLLCRFIHKRKSFGHERELKALIQDLPSKSDPDGSTGSVFNCISNAEACRLVPVQLLEPIEKVYIAPVPLQNPILPRS